MILLMSQQHLHSLYVWYILTMFGHPFHSLRPLSLAQLVRSKALTMLEEKLPVRASHVESALDIPRTEIDP